MLQIENYIENYKIYKDKYKFWNKMNQKLKK